MGSRLPLLAAALVTVAALAVALVFLLRPARDTGASAAVLAGPSAAADDAVAPSDLRGGVSSAADERGAATSARSAAVAPQAQPTTAPAADTATAVEFSGRVVDAMGAPVGGADVRLVPALGPATFQRNGRDRASARSAADGRFTVRADAFAGGQLEVGADGFEPHRVELRASAPGSRNALGDIAIARGAVITGRVVDSFGRAVPGVRVELDTQPTSFSGMQIVARNALFGGDALAITDDSGHFSASRLPLGPFRLRFESQRHPTHWREGTTTEYEPRLDGVLVTLEEGAAIEGLVLGRPQGAVEADVVATRTNVPGGGGMRGGDFGGFGGGERRGEILADGSFRVEGLVAGGDYRLRVSARSMTSERSGRRQQFTFMGGRSFSGTVQARAGSRDVRIEWREPAGLTVRVVDATTGEPVPNVRASYAQGQQGAMANFFMQPEVQHGESVELADLDVRGDRPGSLTIDADGYAIEEVPIAALSPGEHRDLGTVAVKAVPSLAVHVKDRTGAPVVGATVRLSPAATGEDGVVEIAGRRTRLPRGVANVRVAAGPAGASVASPFGDAGRSARTDERGVAIVVHPGGGAATLTVDADGFASFREDNVPAPNEDRVRHDVRLGPGGTVVVRVVDGQGAPVAGANVDHRAPEGGPADMRAMFAAMSGGLVTDAAGEVRLERLAIGRHSFRLREAGGSVALGSVMIAIGGDDDTEGWTSVDLVEGDMREVVLRAEPKGSVTGVVREGGRPLAGAEVRLVAEGEGPPGAGRRRAMVMGDFGPSVRTDGQGRYTIADVAPGEYTLRVSHSRRAMPDEHPLVVTAAELRHDVDLATTAVEGRVTTPDGKPLAGVRVRAERTGDRRGPRAQAFAISVAGADEEFTEVLTNAGGEGGRTDEQGRFRLNGLPAGVDLVVHAEGPDIESARSTAFRLARDEVRTDLRIEARAAGRVRVVLTRASGELGMHIVEAVPAEGEPIRQFAGPNGRANLTGLAPGRWTIRVDTIGTPGSVGGGRETVATREIDVVAGANPDLEIALPPQ